LSPAPKLTLEVDRASAVVDLAVDVELGSTPDKAEGELKFLLVGERSAGAVEQQVAVVVLDVCLEVAGPGQALRVAAPRLLEELGLGDVGQGRADLLD
jgi:hypothetical protein